MGTGGVKHLQALGAPLITYSLIQKPQLVIVHEITVLFFFFFLLRVGPPTPVTGTFSPALKKLLAASYGMCVLLC